MNAAERAELIASLRWYARQWVDIDIGACVLATDAADLIEQQAAEIEQLKQTYEDCEVRNMALMAENAHVAYYHPGWPEVMEAYKRGRAGAVDDLTYHGDAPV